MTAPRIAADETGRRAAETGACYVTPTALLRPPALRAALLAPARRERRRELREALAVLDALIVVTPRHRRERVEVEPGVWEQVGDGRE